MKISTTWLTSCNVVPYEAVLSPEQSEFPKVQPVAIVPYYLIWHYQFGHCFSLMGRTLQVFVGYQIALNFLFTRLNKLGLV